jgi:integrase
MKPTKPAAKWPRDVTVGNASVRVYRNTEPTNASGISYVIAWKSPTGRQRKKFADEDAALLEARIKAGQLNAGRIEGASMSQGDRDELLALRKLAGDVPPMAAMAEWAKARELTVGNVLIAAKAWASKQGKVEVRVTVADVVKEFLAVKTAAGKNVASDHKHTFHRITTDLGTFSIGSVSARQLDAWLAGTENPVSRNTHRKRLVAVWRWAQRKGYLPRDARTEAEMTDRAHEPAPVIGIIDVKTWAALLAYFRAKFPQYLAPLVVAGFCGLRRAEVHAQTWEDISTERKNLRVTQGKRGTPARRMVPLSAAAVAWLNVCDGEHTAEICYDYAMDRIRLLARVAVNEHGKPMFPPLPENCFRHAYISHAVAGTGDIPRVSLDAGNSPKEINRHYRELVSEDDGRAWFALLPA